MSIVELLHRLKDSNIELGLTGDDIEVNFDGQELPAGIQEEIRDNKTAIVAFLKEMSAGHTLSAFVRERPAQIPLSYAQERLWFIDELSGSIQYHMTISFRLKGPLDREGLAYSFQAVTRRHESLRTVIREHHGEAYQQVLPAGGWSMDYREDPGVDEETLHLYFEAFFARPFDLKRDHMLRVELIRVGEEEHVLLMVVHHIASDGLSWAIMIRELAEGYAGYREGRAPRWRELPFQYADYALWQRNYISGAVLEGQLHYWKNKLDGVSPLELPADHPRPPVQSSRGASQGFRIPGELRDGLQELARRQRVTLFMLLLSAYKVLLYRYSGQEDICIGTPVAGRTQPELEELIGFFINMLPLRSRVRAEASFLSLLQEVKETTLEAYEHQDAPFGKLVEMLVKERDMSRTPLFQVAFTLQNASNFPSLKLGEAELLPEVSWNKTTSQFDMNFMLMEDSLGISLAVEYCTDLYEAETIRRMGVHYTGLLHSIAGNPGQPIAALEMLTTPERHRLLHVFSGTAAGYPVERTLVDLFAEQAARTPEAVALCFEQQTLTYRQLDERSNRLGHRLRQLGVTEETPVAICIERCPEMIVAILGVLKAAGAYVPIDPQYPAHRIGYILQDTAAPIILTSRSSHAGLPPNYAGNILRLDDDGPQIDACEDSLPPTLLRPHNLAYIIYTSGSTGQPKGVMIEHRNVVSLLFGFQEAAGADPGGSGLSVCPYSFDVSAWEFFITLCFGNALHIVKGEHVLDPAFLGDYLVKNKITTAYIPPTLLAETANVLEPAKDNVTLKRLLTGVLPIRQSVLQRYIDMVPAIRIINGYGPTETTICATFFPFRKAASPDQSTPIGKPVAN